MYRIGNEVIFDENRTGDMYRSPKSSRPKWMRWTSGKIKTNRAGRKYICEIGWELRPGNRWYITCLRYTEVKTTWKTN